MSFPRRRALVTLAGAAAVAAALAVVTGPATAGPAGAVAAASPSAAPTAPPAVHVVGNQLVASSGRPVRLLGVDRSGTEYACAQGWGIFDGPSDQASVDAIASWHVNAVRVPLNEDCWLGINGVPAAYAGDNYRSAVAAYVAELNADGMVAVLDLHWSAPGGQLALGQQVAPDADHSPAFWSSVASAFKADPGVVFDLYNEPHDVSWACWLDGCTTSAGWQSAGMQQLLDAVRAAGATQPVLVEGLNWGGDLTQWLAHEPVDPLGQLAASVHIYNFSQCDTATCWNATIAPVATRVPVVTGELGENDCADGFVDSYMTWADSVGVSYLGWSWNTAGCSSFPALITSYDGTPTAFGAGLQHHLASLAATAAGTGYVVDDAGGVTGFSTGTAPSAPLPSGPGATPATRDLALLPGGTGGYVLDGWGGVHPFAVGGNARPPAAYLSAYTPEQDVARRIAVDPDGQGGYVVDSAGAVAPFSIGTAPMPAPLSGPVTLPTGRQAVGMGLADG